MCNLIPKRTNLLIDFFEWTRGRYKSKRSIHKQSSMTTIIKHSPIFGELMCNRCGSRLTVKQHIVNQKDPYFHLEQTLVKCPVCKQNTKIKIYN
jgi:hypothetical protein